MSESKSIQALDEFSRSGRLDLILEEICVFLASKLKIIDGPVRGGSNEIYQVQCEDGRVYCVRVLLDANFSQTFTHGIRVLQSCKSSIPNLAAPHVLLISQDFILMEYLVGKTLGAWNIKSLSNTFRKTFLDNLASFLYSIWTVELKCPLPGRSSSPTQCNKILTRKGPVGHKIYEQWLRAEIDRGLRRCIMTYPR